jgi:hypothetical protein
MARMTKKQLEEKIAQLEQRIIELQSQMLALFLRQPIAPQALPTFQPPVVIPSPVMPYLPHIGDWPGHSTTICTSSNLSSCLERTQRD